MGKSESEIWKEIRSMKPEKEEKAPERMRAALDLLGKPEGLFRSVLVLGEGSASASGLLCSLLESYGISYGLFRPRGSSLAGCLMAKGERVEEKRLADLFGELKNFLSFAKEKFEKESLGAMGPLEALLCLAALEFSDEPVDVAVFDAGAGEAIGPYSALGAAGCVFTPLPEGAGAALIGPGSFSLSSAQEEGLASALKERALDAGAAISFDGEDMEVLKDLPAVGGQVADLSTPRGIYPQVPIKLFGGFEAHMALLALAAGENLIGEGKLEESLACEAFAAVKVPGSLRPVAKDPLTLASSASSKFEVGTCLKAVEENFAPSSLAAVVAPGERFEPECLPLLERSAAFAVFAPNPSKAGAGSFDLSRFAKTFPSGRAAAAGNFKEALEEGRSAALASGGAVLCLGGEGAFLKAEEAFRK